MLPRVNSITDMMEPESNSIEKQLFTEAERIKYTFDHICKADDYSLEGEMREALDEFLEAMDAEKGVLFSSVLNNYLKLLPNVVVKYMDNGIIDKFIDFIDANAKRIVSAVNAYAIKNVALNVLKFYRETEASNFLAELEKWCKDNRDKIDKKNAGYFEAYCYYLQWRGAYSISGFEGKPEMENIEVFGILRSLQSEWDKLVWEIKNTVKRELPDAPAEKWSEREQELKDERIPNNFNWGTVVKNVLDELYKKLKRKRSGEDSNSQFAALSNLCGTGGEEKDQDKVDASLKTSLGKLHGLLANCKDGKLTDRDDNQIWTEKDRCYVIAEIVKRYCERIKLQRGKLKEAYLQDEMRQLVTSRIKEFENDILAVLFNLKDPETRKYAFKEENNGIYKTLGDMLFAHNIYGEAEKLYNAFLAGAKRLGNNNPKANAEVYYNMALMAVHTADGSDEKYNLARKWLDNAKEEFHDSYENKKNPGINEKQIARLEATISRLSGGIERKLSDILRKKYDRDEQWQADFLYICKPTGGRQKYGDGGYKPTPGELLLIEAILRKNASPEQIERFFNRCKPVDYIRTMDIDTDIELNTGSTPREQATSREMLEVAMIRLQRDIDDLENEWRNDISRYELARIVYRSLEQQFAEYRSSLIAALAKNGIREFVLALAYSMTRASFDRNSLDALILQLTPRGLVECIEKLERDFKEDAVRTFLLRSLKKEVAKVLWGVAEGTEERFRNRLVVLLRMARTVSDSVGFKKPWVSLLWQLYNRTDTTRREEFKRSVYEIWARGNWYLNNNLYNGCDGAMEMAAQSGSAFIKMLSDVLTKKEGNDNENYHKYQIPYYARSRAMLSLLSDDMCKKEEYKKTWIEEYKKRNNNEEPDMEYFDALQAEYDRRYKVHDARAVAGFFHRYNTITLEKYLHHTFAERDTNGAPCQTIGGTKYTAEEYVDKMVGYVGDMCGMQYFPRRLAGMLRDYVNGDLKTDELTGQQYRWQDAHFKLHTHSLKSQRDELEMNCFPAENSDIFEWSDERSSVRVVENNTVLSVMQDAFKQFKQAEMKNDDCRLEITDCNNNGRVWRSYEAEEDDNNNNGQPNGRRVRRSSAIDFYCALPDFARFLCLLYADLSQKVRNEDGTPGTIRLALSCSESETVVDGYREITVSITHQDTNIVRSAKDVCAAYREGKGFFQNLREALLDVCDWSVEAVWPGEDGGKKAIEFLSDRTVGQRAKAFVHDCDSDIAPDQFRHVLKFYNLASNRI